MSTFLKFPSIEQFRKVVKDVNFKSEFQGVKEDGSLIMDPTAPRPTITFKGTVKIHGTNASVCWNKDSELWIQVWVVPISFDHGCLEVVGHNRLGNSAEVMKGIF